MSLNIKRAHDPLVHYTVLQHNIVFIHNTQQYTSNINSLLMPCVTFYLGVLYKQLNSIKE